MNNFMPISATTDKMGKSLEKYNSPKMTREIYNNNFPLYMKEVTFIVSKNLKQNEIHAQMISCWILPFI